ncbi:MAG: hypothetical protein ABW189_03800 [Rickettsiales bacterium]
MSSPDEISFHSASIPTADEMKNVRKEALQILKELYSVAENIEQKQTVMAAMTSATHTPTMSICDDNLKNMIADDTADFLEFMASILDKEELQIKQKMEHDAYFFFRRGMTAREKEAALRIKAILDKDTEYQIFKVLIGYEGIFSKWEEGENLRDNYSEWKNRILA